ncbi:MAG: hypothetical protein CML05_08395 [Pseudozobellia sp.]|nr:hypothetical protein [Pseudozobellia sp.]|tara:strand:- start:757 stop:1152 length:396 start_codon:yes stop_codon:yes gene_type:complete
MKKGKWLIYTVIVGLLPFLLRSIIFFFDKTATSDYWFNEVDFIIFGLVLNITNVNELEDKIIDNKIWKTKAIGISVLLLLLYTALLTMLLLYELNGTNNLDTLKIKYSSIILGSVSLLFSYSIYHRLNKTL